MFCEFDGYDLRTGMVCRVFIDPEQVSVIVYAEVLPVGVYGTHPLNPEGKLNTAEIALKGGQSVVVLDPKREVMDAIRTEIETEQSKREYFVVQMIDRRMGKVSLR